MSFIVIKFAFYCNVPLCDRAVSFVKHKIPLLNFCKIRQMIDGRGYYRQQYSCRHFLGPVTLYSVLYNLPKFSEFTTVCLPMNTTTVLYCTVLHCTVLYCRSASP